MIDEAKKNLVSESNGVDNAQIKVTKPDGSESIQDKDGNEVQSDNSEEEKQPLVGADFDFSFQDGKLVIFVKHVGAAAYANLEVGADALPFINKLVDAIEKAVPGDQTGLANSLKRMIADIKF